MRKDKFNKRSFSAATENVQKLVTEHLFLKKEKKKKIDFPNYQQIYSSQSHMDNSTHAFMCVRKPNADVFEFFFLPGCHNKLTLKMYTVNSQNAGEIATGFY